MSGFPFSSMGLHLVSLIIHVDYDKETYLSPLLIVVAMEALSMMISATVDNGLFSQFSVGASNLFFFFFDK